MKRTKILSKVVAHAALALLLGSPMIAFAQQAQGNATPAAQLKAAWAKLEAFKSYKELRVRLVHGPALPDSYTPILE